MSNPYIAQDVLDQCREAIRQGKTLDYLAGHLRCEPGHLGNLLGLSQAKPVPATQSSEFDLWRSDELQAQL